MHTKSNQRLIVSQSTKHGYSDHVNTVLNEEYYITREETKKIHLKYRGKYVKKAWENHRILKKT